MDLLQIGAGRDLRSHFSYLRERDVARNNGLDLDFVGRAGRI